LIAKSCLIYHPDTTDAAIKALYIGVKALYQNDGLMLHYELAGALDNLLIPGLQSPNEMDGLWQHTCFEAFVAVVDDETRTRYHEFNFSPSGQWAAYAFTNYRQRKVWHASSPPTIRYTRSSNQLTLGTVINIADLPDKPVHQPYRLGLSAVLETKKGGLSYWALCHPSGAPDFHHRRGFTLSLNPA
jgi:hypothetical protein